MTKDNITSKSKQLKELEKERDYLYKVLDFILDHTKRTEYLVRDRIVKVQEEIIKLKEK